MRSRAVRPVRTVAQWPAAHRGSVGRGDSCRLSGSLRRDPRGRHIERVEPAIRNDRDLRSDRTGENEDAVAGRRSNAQRRGPEILRVVRDSLISKEEHLGLLRPARLRMCRTIPPHIPQARELGNASQTIDALAVIEDRRRVQALFGVRRPAPRGVR